ncbi:MAG TPA: hypothetical protein VG755_38590 [Nannocystaceae bacterium]|nr:hypothetical protein [Nannocystaceae bacterium]
MSGSDERDDDGPGEGRSEPAAEPVKAKRPSDEDGLDLDDLEAHGVDGLVAQLRQGTPDVEPPPPPTRRIQRGRSPMLSVVVIGAGLYMLMGVLWADFRYWLHSNTPRDLGTAAEIAVDGRMPQGLHDEYVVIRGTPDVRNALRGTTRTEHIGYLRLIEGGGSLFAAVRRPLDKPIRDEFEGQFTGRMQRLENNPAAGWIEEFINSEDLIRTIDAEPDALWSALGSGADPLVVTTTEGQTRVGVKERVRLVVHPPDARVQLGKKSWPDAEKAEEAVKALGYPYRNVGKGELFHSFVVRIPEAERAAITAKLNQGVELDGDQPDPKVGALVLPGTVAFSAPVSDYQLEGDRVTLPREGDEGPALHDVDGDKLVVHRDAAGRVSIPKAWVHAVRIEEPIVFDRSGYLVAVGDEPSDHRAAGIGWLVIAALVGINIASLVQHVRRRAAAA